LGNLSKLGDEGAEPLMDELDRHVGFQ